MRIHKAGFGVIAVFLLILGSILAAHFYFFGSSLFFNVLTIAFSLLLLFVVRFFRFPNRKIEFSEDEVICPADGKVVVIEEIDEKEFVSQKRIQVSIFMSVWNVHINWFPVIGKVLSTEHFNGRYMAAILPKSSHENERSVTVLESSKGEKIVVKQIAGAVARRIITYAKKGEYAKAGGQLGFIRFGSRVDVLLPVNSEIKIELNQKVKGGKTLLAKLK